MNDPVQPPDPGRRRFFRQFAGEVATSAASVIGAAQVLQQQSAEAARELLAGDAGTLTDSAALAPVRSDEVDASTAGYRAPFRWDGEVCWVVDQRRLPDRLADIEVRGAADAVSAMNDGAITGGAVQAQLAAVTLALVARRSVASRAFARRATIRGAANALRQTRPGSAAVALAIDRQLALLEGFDNEVPGETVEAALRTEAEAIIAEASADHGALVDHALAALAGVGGTELRVLTLGSSGPMGSGQFGTAVSVIITAHHAERRIHALVAETRPGFEGARVATWELAQAGVPHALVTDAGAAASIAAGEVDAVLVTAERICANGDVLGVTGTYPVALAAAAADVPFVVLVATTAVDLGTPDAAAAPLEDGRPRAVLTAGGSRIAPEGTSIRNPRLDRTPGSLLSAIITEEGVVQAPLDEGLTAHMQAAVVRRAAAAGFEALVAQRLAAAT